MTNEDAQEAVNTEALAVAEAKAALESAIAATAAARSKREQAEQDLLSVRKNNAKQRQEAALMAVAELNEATDLESAARERLAAAEHNADLAEIERLRAKSDPEAARQRIEAALDLAIKHSVELRGEFLSIDAMLDETRSAALMARRIARLRKVEVDAPVLPARLGTALRMQMEFARGVPRVTWAPPLTDAHEVASAIKEVMGVVEPPVRNGHWFHKEVGSAEDQIQLAIAGEYQRLANEWNDRHTAELEQGRARHEAMVAEYKIAYEDYARTHSEESKVRLHAAREAFRHRPAAAQPSASELA